MSISEKHWFFFAFVIYSIVAWFSVGHYHDDEYYQILDFAAYKLGFEMQNTLMWEYKEGVRSGLQPFIAYVVAKGLTFINITAPFVWAFYLRLISLIISFISVFAFFQIIKRDIKTDRTQALVLFFLLFSWILVFLNVRFSSEGWATSLFILAYALYFFQESEKTIKLEADNDMQLKAVRDMLENRAISRKLSIKIFDFQNKENASGMSVRQIIKLREVLAMIMQKKSIR